MFSLDCKHTVCFEYIDTIIMPARKHSSMRFRRLTSDPFLAVGLMLLATVAMTTSLFFYLTNINNCQFHSENIPPVRRTNDPKITPLLFIGGWPRSGTTLIRAMLDAHPDIRCGEETQVIPVVLTKIMGHRQNPQGAQRLREAGITDDVLYSALSQFILGLVVGHGEPADRLCNKDPFTLSHMPELLEMFPLGQFLLMIRDGRAVCHSVLSRNIRISTVQQNNLTQCLANWNRIVMKMYYDCLTLGDLKCHPVRYEQLVLHPRSTLTRVLKFIGVPWNNVVLHHEDQINKPGGISLSRLEPSTDQVIKPVNLDSLTKWAASIPDDVKKTMRQVAPMLELLGYDSDAYPPNYGEPDKEVVENTLLIQKYQSHFEQLGWIARNRTKVLDN